ncbi:MAG TPA: P1 family peptidase [Actinomycetota bacterium]|nr:P1 family peptidase [Actinomycetota bacterium]
MITDVPGIRVGHWTDRSGITGCTVVLPPPGTVGSGQVRGGAPGTRETDLLRPGMLIREVHAVLLTGGSAFGLAAADGVMRFLEERGVGFDTGVARVPIVPGAVIFDLAVGDPAARPGPGAGYAACAAARSGPVEEGSVGAGTGATVAKLHGPHRQVKGGVGSVSERRGELVVGALAVVNALGEVLDEEGAVLAGARPGEDRGTEPWPWGGPDRPGPPPGRSTTLVVVATNARLGKEDAHRLAGAAHGGLAAAIRPSHTIWDGDAAFTLATGAVDAAWDELEEMAGPAVAAAVRRGVRAAVGVPGAPGLGEAP